MSGKIRGNTSMMLRFDRLIMPDKPLGREPKSVCLTEAVELQRISGAEVPDFGTDTSKLIRRKKG
jgi:hypothetical protein